MTSTSMRWNRLPPGLEEVLQGWLGPKGWTEGAPAFVTLGMNGAYIAVSESNASGWDLAESYPILQEYLQHWGLDDTPSNLWSTIKVCKRVNDITEIFPR